MINHELIKYNNKLFFLYRKFKTHHVKSDKIHDLMYLLECNLVLKKTTEQNVEYLYYLKEVPDLEVLN